MMDVFTLYYVLAQEQIMSNLVTPGVILLFTDFSN